MSSDKHDRVIDLGNIVCWIKDIMYIYEESPLQRAVIEIKRDNVNHTLRTCMSLEDLKKKLRAALGSDYIN